MPLGALGPREVDTGPPLLPRKCGTRSLSQCLKCALAGQSLLETRPRVTQTALLVLKILATSQPPVGFRALGLHPSPPAEHLLFRAAGGLGPSVVVVRSW